MEKHFRFISSVLIFYFIVPCNIALSQTGVSERDDKIYKMVNEISADNIKADIEKLASFKTRHTLSRTDSDTEGIGAARRWVKSEFEKYAKDSDGRLLVSFDSFFVEPDNRRIPRRVELKNVMATLKGTDPNDDRIFIVSGHLDSRASNALDSTSLAPGADDDASGVAVVMELARVMSKRKFPATIIFVAVSGEEQGLFGSTHLAKEAKEKNWNIIAMLNNDMVSGNNSTTNLKDNVTVRVFSEGIPALESEELVRLRKIVGGENDSNSRELARYISEVAERYVDQLKVKLIYRSDRFLRGGDHTPFNREGFTAVRFCEMYENYDHQHQDVRVENGVQYGDLPQFIDAYYAGKIAGANLSTLANLNLAPASPENVGVDVKELTNNTTLMWKAPKGKAPYGYYILMRETDQPNWQKKTFVKETKVTLPYSKDNFIFAVQSVDQEGHESLPVIPAPIFR